MRYFNLFLLTALMLCAACQSQSATQQAFSVTLAPDVEEAAVLVTAVPTLIQPTRTPSPTLTETPLPTATPEPTVEPTATSAAEELAALDIELASIPQHIDHYALHRPISRQGVDHIDRTYAYGDTQQGAWEIHHGVEFVNPRGTPVLAAAAGIVVYAGDDRETLVGPRLNYYGNVVVIEHDVYSPEGLTVYTLYGHLDRVAVTEGQTVQQGERVGVVGDTGIAIGPHLHFEVRLGDPFDFGATRNPELWLFPYPQFGTLAGRVTDTDSEPVYGLPIQVRTVGRSGIRYAYTYWGDSVNSSAVWGENFTLGDLPEGEYEVLISENGRVRFREVVVIHPNRTTWIDIQLD